YLLDTHVLLWWLTNPEELSQKAHKIIADKDNSISVSCVSLWEMSIKKSLGRLNLPLNILEIMHNEGFKILSIGPEEALGISDLPFIHQDPFDRMLVMQAKMHDFVLITRDTHIMKYPVVTIKA
ncbi:MAG: type II toxin-antitoxin system VapC family toxin, partial [Verrucomicrobia bacterium]|nr:type II toxin-antitoxin system VapC family toxin [Verrucomicrobiota bacterium]